MHEIKKEVIDLIEKLPDDSSIEDIMEELYFKVQVDEGLKQLDAGDTVSHNEVRERMSKWIIK